MQIRAGSQKPAAANDGAVDAISSSRGSPLSKCSTPTIYNCSAGDSYVDVDGRLVIVSHFRLLVGAVDAIIMQISNLPSLFAAKDYP